MRLLRSVATGPEAVLLRYVFDSPEQVRAHVHGDQHRALLFFPETLALPPGTPALLDVTFASSTQHVTTRGTVHSHLRGGPGTWLEVGTPRLADDSRLGGMHVRRRYRRLGLNLQARLENGARESTVMVHDVSLGGARLTSVPSHVRLGDTVRIDLSDGGEAQALVARRTRSEAGLRWERWDLGTCAAVGILMERAAAQWSTAREVRHAVSCNCSQGASSDPTPPRASLHMVATA